MLARAYTGEPSCANRAQKHVRPTGHYTHAIAQAVGGNVGNVCKRVLLQVGHLAHPRKTRKRGGSVQDPEGATPCARDLCRGPVWTHVSFSDGTQQSGRKPSGREREFDEDCGAVGEGVRVSIDMLGEAVTPREHVNDRNLHGPRPRRGSG